MTADMLERAEEQPEGEGVETTTDVATEAPAAETPELRVADRCDQCGAQAFVLIELATQALLFCKHHFERHEPALVAQGVRVVVDDRHKINQRPGGSA